MELKSEGTDAAEDPSRKFKELAEKRKLNQIVKQRTDEIEFLRDELDRLRERTFPSFAHLVPRSLWDSSGVRGRTARAARSV